MAKINDCLSTVFLILIRVYQLFFSGFLGNHCRFYPSCSKYTYLAIQKFGFIKGIFCGFKRISCCHPWHTGGYDPLP